tara:strand:- start:162 stop:827 length:666 start_codon:yes stop_codon:yes gene_type:complete
MNYSLIIPIYNEENTLYNLISSLELLDDNIEIIIINDGSTDRTASILNNQKIIKTLHKPRNEGKGAAIITGLDYITKENVILMDGDLEISVNEIPKLIKIYESKKNHILVGTRWNEKLIDLNYLGNLFINWIFNILHGTDLKDILCCLKIIDTSIFKKLNIESKGFNIESEIMSKIVLKGFTITEENVEYKRRSRSEGKKLNFSDGFIIIWTILKIKIFQY